MHQTDLFEIYRNIKESFYWFKKNIIMILITITFNLMINTKLSKESNFLRHHFIKTMGLRWPGAEPGSTAWKAAMPTAIQPTLKRKH